MRRPDAPVLRPRIVLAPEQVCELVIGTRISTSTRGRVSGMYVRNLAVKVRDTLYGLVLVVVLVRALDLGKRIPPGGRPREQEALDADGFREQETDDRGNRGMGVQR